MQNDYLRLVKTSKMFSDETAKWLLNATFSLRIWGSRSSRFTSASLFCLLRSCISLSSFEASTSRSLIWSSKEAHNRVGLRPRGGRVVWTGPRENLSQEHQEYCYLDANLSPHLFLQNLTCCLHSVSIYSENLFEMCKPSLKGNRLANLITLCKHLPLHTHLETSINQSQRWTPSHNGCRMRS